MASYHLRVKDDTKSGGKRISAKKHVDYILREEGEAHAYYINREGAQSDRNDCVFKGSHLPKWAKGSAQKFFSAATRYEDKGNVRYREIELSLPNELSLEQNLEIVSRFIAEHLSNHYYAYAVHEKVGELSGEWHPHVHIMFSERLIDDVEKMGERPACKYFRRAAKPLKGERVASFERRCQHGALKTQREEAIDTCNSLMLKRIFPSEAMNIAKNIFVHDGFKKLQTEQKEYKKALADYKRETSEMRERELLFFSRKWMNNGEKLQAQYYLTKAKINLEETGRRLSHSKIRLENELTRLKNLCQTEEAQEKIALLAADILHKNLKITLEYEEAKKRVGDLYEKLQDSKKRFNAFDEGYRRLKQNRVYRIIQPESNSPKNSALKENELVAIIADALLGEPYAVQLVAFSSGNNLEMEKDWEMMTEFDKDELIRKKIIREL